MELVDSCLRCLLDADDGGLSASRRADGAKKVNSVLLEKSEAGACGVGFVTRLKLRRDNRASLQTRATTNTEGGIHYQYVPEHSDNGRTERMEVNIKILLML